MFQTYQFSNLSQPVIRFLRNTFLDFLWGSLNIHLTVSLLLNSFCHFLTASLYEDFLVFQRVHKNNPGRLKWYSMVGSTQISEWGHQYNEMVVQCSYSNTKCSRLREEGRMDIIQNTTQQYGNCFSFVPKEDTVQPGPKFGLVFCGLFTNNTSQDWSITYLQCIFSLPMVEIRLKTFLYFRVGNS